MSTEPLTPSGQSKGDTVKFWHANRLDQEAEHDPVEVVEKFINACRDGYDLGRCRPSFEWTLRWWLTDSTQFNAVWDEADWDQLVDELVKRKDAGDMEFIWEALMEPHRRREAPRV